MPQTFPSPSQSVTALTQLPLAIGQTLQTVRDTGFGGRIDCHCDTYSHFLGIRTKTHHHFYEVVVSLDEAALTNSLGALQQTASGFLAQYAGVTDWIASLPATSETITGRTSEAQRIVDALAARPDGPDPALLDVLEKLIGVMVSALADSRARLDTANDALAGFEDDLQGAIASVSAALSGLPAGIAAAQARAQAQINAAPCGQSGSTADLQQIVAQMNAAGTAVRGAVTSLDGRTGAGIAALQSLIGIVADTSQSIAGIQTTLQTASGAQLSDFLRQVNLQAALAQWQAVVVAAQALDPDEMERVRAVLAAYAAPAERGPDRRAAGR